MLIYPPITDSILTLWQYAISKKVVLPSDLKGKDRPSASTHAAATATIARGREKPPSDVGKQLEAVKAHIEDLHVRPVAVASLAGCNVTVTNRDSSRPQCPTYLEFSHDG